MLIAVKLVWLLVFGIYVLRGADDTDRKLINFLIIAGSALVGLVIALMVGYGNNTLREVAFSMGLVGADVGCVIAAAWNYWRAGGIYKGKKGKGMKSDKPLI